MATALRLRTLVLFAGDVIAFYVGLWLSLFLRELAPPPDAFFYAHLLPFSLLFVAWVAVYFIAGLYENRSVLLARRALSTTLLTAQTFNLALAALFFFFVPLFGIAPKTLLFIYLPVSFALGLLWRAGIFPILGLNNPEPVTVVGTGPELAEIRGVLARAHRPPVRIVEEGGTLVSLPQLYEDLYGRVMFSRVDEGALVESLSQRAHPLYDKLKRAMDIAIALPAAVASLVLYPFIALAIKLYDGGEVIIAMPRVGLRGEVVVMHKFRSMTGNDAGNWGAGGTALRVTPVGAFLRKTRLDELPQLWDIVGGSFSLIGPRPEFPKAVAEYEREIPYYGLRHLVRPGLSGWAQLYHDNHPHHGTEVEATREKLSYDLYYLKHRSLILDLTIALKTIKKLLTRSGA